MVHKSIIMQRILTLLVAMLVGCQQLPTPESEPDVRSRVPVSPGFVHWHAGGFDAAMAASKESGRPVLLFELLGDLDDAHCGADGQLARSVLFSNPGVAEVMNGSFECAWRSMGNVDRSRAVSAGGASAGRPPGGSAAMWICDGNGVVMDVLPGVLDAPAYLTSLQEEAWVVDPKSRQFIVDGVGEDDWSNAYHMSRMGIQSLGWIRFIHAQQFNDSRIHWRGEEPVEYRLGLLSRFPTESQVDVEDVFAVETSGVQGLPIMATIGRAKPEAFRSLQEEASWISKNQLRPQALALMYLEAGATVEQLTPYVQRLVLHLHAAIPQ